MKYYINGDEVSEQTFKRDSEDNFNSGGTFARIVGNHSAMAMYLTSGGGMDKMINAENEEIEKHIEAMEEELKRRSV